ncbi:FAST kinase domain-containing protein 1, mitochondrial-like [Ranitomeya variabilis]|uniref:FAST kinase domain-containing protein 1, mitochondrial-like n=1 Tax=Ranitomeya variabilis TaxID=490064 RepID=UPI004055A019
MFCWRRALPLSLRFFQMRSISSDPLLDQLMTSTNQFQIFQLVGIHKSKLTVHHVGCAINTLWELQKGKPSANANHETVRNHPEFIALRILAENKIDFMSDTTLVNTLYAVIRFNVEAHDSLVQQLLMEGWRRLEKFEPETLSKFSVCLEKLDLGSSPLMGKVANALNTGLENIQNIRYLSSLMMKTFPVTSKRLQHRLISKAESLMEGDNYIDVHSVRRVVQFLCLMKYDYQPLLDKCNQIFVRDKNKMSTDTMCIVSGLYRQMAFKQYEFQVMAKLSLLEISNLWNNADHFGKIFCALFPMASQEIRNRLEDDLVILAGKIHHISLVYVLETMAEAECKNPILIQKICSAIQDNLDHYHRLYLCKLTDAVVCLPCQNYQPFADLQKRLTAFMKTSHVPSMVVMMTRSLSLLTLTRVDEAVLRKIDDVIPQCDLSDLNSIANSVIRWLQPAQLSRQNKSGMYEKLLHKVSRYGLERVKNMDDIDHLLNELTYVMNGQWLQNMLIDDILLTCQRLLHQVTWRNAPFLALVISYCNTLCPPVLDKIAEVTMENVTKVEAPLVARLRREARSRRAGWLEEQLTGLLGGSDSQDSGSRGRSSRRSRPPERLSPDTTPHGRRRPRSPSRDPAGAGGRGAATPPAPPSGRNPLGGPAGARRRGAAGAGQARQDAGASPDVMAALPVRPGRERGSAAAPTSALQTRRGAAPAAVIPGTVRGRSAAAAAADRSRDPGSTAAGAPRPLPHGAPGSGTGRRSRMVARPVASPRQGARGRGSAGAAHRADGPAAAPRGLMQAARSRSSRRSRERSPSPVSVPPGDVEARGAGLGQRSNSDDSGSEHRDESDRQASGGTAGGDTAPAQPHSFPPHLLVLVGFTLAVAQYFPEDLIKAIFNIRFLTKLDSELDTFLPDKSAKIRMRLMQLNRAVCLECPEYQVPWFHEEYCRQMKHREGNSKRSIYHQIHLFLGDLFGGVNYAKMFVTTPYYYTVDFECILSKNKKPTAYIEENKLSANVAEVQWGQDSQMCDNKSLPQGAQSIAVVLIDCPPAEPYATGGGRSWQPNRVYLICLRSTSLQDPLKCLYARNGRCPELLPSLPAICF